MLFVTKKSHSESYHHLIVVTVDYSTHGSYEINLMVCLIYMTASINLGITAFNKIVFINTILSCF